MTPSTSATACRLMCASQVSGEILASLRSLTERWGPARTDDQDQLLGLNVVRYEAMLQSIAELTGSLAFRCSQAQAFLVNSHEARLCAILRAFCRSGQPPSQQKVLSLAGKLSVWMPLTETIRVRWMPKGKGGWRPISSFGPLRTAQALIVRDMLSVLGIDSPYDFSRRGGGGERSLVHKVCDHIKNGVDWWWSPDVKGCYTSIKPGHFRWLPIDRRLLTNIAFIPKCAKIKVIERDEPEESLRIIHSVTLDPQVNSLSDFTIHLVRRGLPQGSVLSPLLARALVGRTLRTPLNERGAEGHSYSDDLTIGARTKQELGAARQAVTTAFSSLSAGPLELHNAPIASARKGQVFVLGYRLEPGRGYGSNPVHVKPGKPRIHRFKQRLADRLKAAGDGADLFSVAETYRRSWFNGQTAWTKVPFHSNDLSSTITLLYVIDFERGEPMGGCWRSE